MDKATKAHHQLMAKNMQEVTDLHKALADHHKDGDPEGSEKHAGLSKCFQKMTDDHEKMGALPVDKAEGGDAELMKGFRELLKTIQPTNVRMVPASDRPTLVPRTGQPDPVEKTQIDKKLEDIVYDPNQAEG